MTLEHALDSLDDAIYGEEPDYQAEPVTPRDRAHATGLLGQLGRVWAEMAHVEEAARLRKLQIEQFREREAARLEAQEKWLTESLERFHRAVLAVDPKALTITLPEGELVSRDSTEWAYTDPEAFLAWALAHRIEVVRQKAAPAPEIDKAAVKATLRVPDPSDPKGKRLILGVDPETQERPPGLEVRPHIRKFTPTPRSAEPAEEEQT